MRRRGFIALVTGAAALHPIASYAQRTQRSVPVVGVIWIGTASAQIPVRIREALLQGLRENGYTPGQNITVEDRYFVACTRFRRHRVKVLMEQEASHGEATVYARVQG